MINVGNLGNGRNHRGGDQVAERESEANVIGGGFGKVPVVKWRKSM